MLLSTIFKASFIMTFPHESVSWWGNQVISHCFSGVKRQREGVNKKQVSSCCVGECERRLGPWIIENTGKTNLMFSQYYKKIYSHSLLFQSNYTQNLDVQNCKLKRMKNTKVYLSKKMNNYCSILTLNKDKDKYWIHKVPFKLNELDPGDMYRLFRIQVSASEIQTHIVIK